MEDIVEAVKADPGMQILAQNSLRARAELRTVKAQLFDVYIGPPDLPILAAVKQRGVDYHSARKAQGKNHKLGSPHKYQAQGLIEYLYSNAGLPSDERTTIENFAKKFPSVDALSPEIPVLRSSITHDKKTKIMIGFGFTAQSDGISTIVKQQMLRGGAEWKEGEAPQDHLERGIREQFRIGREYEASTGIV